MYGSFKDRIPDELKPDRECWAHIIMAALIAILISSLIVLALLPARAPMADIARLDAAGDAMATDIDALESAGPYAGLEDLANVNDSLTDYALDVIDLNWRVTAAENSLENVITYPYQWELGAEYQLYVKGNGNFTANIYLCFEPVVASNATDYNEAVAFFYSGMNWASANQDYIPVVAFNGSAWLIRQAWFNIGTFEVPAELTLNILVAGLNATYAVNHAYAKVYKL